VNVAVLDASALLAWMQVEPGADAVEPLLAGGIVSCVNWTEVIQKSVARNIPIQNLREDMEALGLNFVPFSVVQAEIAGAIWNETRHLGLSLADRACLSLALDQRCPVVTSDRNWTKLTLGIEIKSIR
jgi:ribonuclease VapC